MTTGVVIWLTGRSRDTYLPAPNFALYASQTVKFSLSN